MVTLQTRKDVAKIENEQRMLEQQIQHLRLQSQQNEQFLRDIKDSGADLASGGLIEPSTPPETQEQPYPDRVSQAVKGSSAKKFGTPSPTDRKSSVLQLM